MELKTLPLDLMNPHSCPRQEALDFLESLCVTNYIQRKYESLEDRADAFDGAFIGFHIHQHLSKGLPKEEWLIEMLGWYDLLDQKNLRGPFHDGLRTTLDACNLGDFYQEAIDFIIDNKGKLDY